MLFLELCVHDGRAVLCCAVTALVVNCKYVRDTNSHINRALSLISNVCLLEMLLLKLGLNNCHDQASYAV